MQRPVKIAYVTDRGFLGPTLVSAWSLQENLSGPAELHFWGNGLQEDDWATVRRVVSKNPQLDLICKDISSGYLEGAYGPQDYISAATMGRLFIPRLIDGYVLYIDGDTLVTGNVARLFELDIGDAYAGVVRDYTVTHWLADRKGLTQARATRLSEIGAFMHPTPPSDYFNAGVMLFNCDAIRAEPELLKRVCDVEEASARSHGDQDHLNALFHEKLVQLDPVWNASWGRLGKHRKHLSRCGARAEGAMPGNTEILHYHGPEKPWRDARAGLLSSRGRATLIYRRALRRFGEQYPELMPI